MHASSAAAHPWQSSPSSRWHSGIGANTAIFTIAKKVLLDSLPVKNPHELRLLTWVSGHQQPVPPVWGDVGATEEGGLRSTAFSYPVLEELRKKTDVFADLIAFKADSDDSDR